MKSWKNFERDIAEIFTEAFGQKFYRVPGSGAFVGGKNKLRLETMTDGQKRLFSGDIIPPEELNGLAIECKTRKGFNFNQLFQNSNKELNSWIDQTFENNPLLGLLIFKYARSPTFVLFKARFCLSRGDSYFFYNPTIQEPYIITEFTKEWLDENTKIIQNIISNHPDNCKKE